MRPAGFSCRRTRPVCTGRTCRLPRSPRSRRLHGLPMSPSTSPSDGHAGRTICAGRMSSQTGSPRQAGPSPRASFPKIPPEKRLERRRMSFRAASSAPAQNIAAGRPPMPPCRAPTAQNRGARLHAFSRAKLPQAPQQGRRLGKQTERRDLPRAGFPLPDAFFPMQARKPGNASPFTPS